MTLIFGIYEKSFSWMHNLTLMSHATIEKIHCFTFSLYTSLGDQIWPCRKTGQGQSSIFENTW